MWLAWEKRKAYKILVEIKERKRPIGGRRRKCEDTDILKIDTFKKYNVD